MRATRRSSWCTSGFQTSDPYPNTQTSALGSCSARMPRSEASWSASDSTGNPGWVLRKVSRSRSFSRSDRVSGMLGGFGRGQRGAERGEQLGLLFLRPVQVAALDVAEAADVVWDGRDLHRNPDVGAVEALEKLGHGRFVLPDETALGPALLGHAEDIQARAAQPLEPCEHPERTQHPGTELGFSRLPGARIGPAENRGREMEFQAVPALEHGLDLDPERRVYV